MITRRGFIGASSGTAAAMATAQDPIQKLTRENLKITDIKVALLSYELPKEKQWYTKDLVCWKTDAILVQVFTDKGIVGIGESSQYGGSREVKTFIDGQIRPRLVGKNPFDVEHLAWAWASDPFRGGSLEARGNGQQIGWPGVDAVCEESLRDDAGDYLWLRGRRRRAQRDTKRLARAYFTQWGKTTAQEQSPEIDPKSPRDDGYRVPRAVADLCAARPVHLFILDGISTMAGGQNPGMFGVEVVKPGFLAVGANVVNTAAVGMALMKYDPMADRGMAPFETCDNKLKLAEECGVVTERKTWHDSSGCFPRQGPFPLPFPTR